MMKLKVSYEHPEELTHVIHKLSPDIMRWRVAKQQGKYKRAYIDMRADITVTALKTRAERHTGNG